MKNVLVLLITINFLFFKMITSQHFERDVIWATPICSVTKSNSFRFDARDVEND